MKEEDPFIEVEYKSHNKPEYDLFGIISFDGANLQESRYYSLINKYDASNNHY